MPGLDPSRFRASWIRRRVAAAFTERLPYKAAALFLALVLWLVVSAEEPAEDLVPVRLALLLDTTLALQGDRPTVRALVVGRGRELLKLYATPPVVRRVVSGDAPDTLRLSLAPRDIDIPSGIDAIVRDVEPRTLELHFAPNAERRVPVRSALRVTAAPGLRMVRLPRLSPDSVTVVGPRRALREVDAVWTVREAIVASDTLPISVPLDTTRVPGHVRPSRVSVVVGVEVDRAALDSIIVDQSGGDTSGAAGARTPTPTASAGGPYKRSASGAALGHSGRRPAGVPATRRGGAPPPTANVAPPTPRPPTETVPQGADRRDRPTSPRVAGAAP